MWIPKERNSKFLRMFLLILARAIAVISGIAYFAMAGNTRLSLAMVLKLFYLVILAFKQSFVLEIGNITEVHFQERGKYF